MSRNRRSSLAAVRRAATMERELRRVGTRVKRAPAVVSRGMGLRAILKKKGLAPLMRSFLLLPVAYHPKFATNGKS